MRKENSPIIFDTDLSGNGIVNFFPDKTRAIDLSRVGDQVALFDVMLDNASRGNQGEDCPDFIVDVAANELKRFFRIFSDIGFERGAYEAQLDVRVCHIVSWTLKSLQNAANIRDMLTTASFVGVRNMANEEIPFTPTAEEEASVPNIEIDLFLNKLNPQTWALINQPSFSFAAFISDNYDHLDYETKTDIWNFLEDVYNQTRGEG